MPNAFSSFFWNDVSARIDANIVEPPDDSHNPPGQSRAACETSKNSVSYEYSWIEDFEQRKHNLYNTKDNDRQKSDEAPKKPDVEPLVDVSEVFGWDCQTILFTFEKRIVSINLAIPGFFVRVHEGVNSKEDR